MHTCKSFLSTLYVKPFHLTDSSSCSEPGPWKAKQKSPRGQLIEHTLQQHNLNKIIFHVVETFVIPLSFFEFKEIKSLKMNCSLTLQSIAFLSQIFIEVQLILPKN